MKLESVSNQSPRQEQGQALLVLERARSTLVNSNNVARLQKQFTIVPFAHEEKLADTS